MKKKKILSSLFLMSTILFYSTSCQKEETGSDSITFTDIDGNVYDTVTIGNQLWMVENLKVTRYRNGDPITIVTDTMEWSKLTTEACCEYNNTPTNGEIYGRLYNWYAVNDIRNIAPVGWHVPTADDWIELIDYLGGNEVAGGKLKEAGTSHWNSPNTGATNESGFTALPSGYRANTYGTFHGLGTYGNFWSATQTDDSKAIDFFLIYQSPYCSNFSILKQTGLAVRCIKD